MSGKSLYTIKAVSEMTGLSTFVIRAWENRYNAISPERTETNRRLYSNDDVQKLKLLQNAVKKGYKIRNIANLNEEELRQLVVIKQTDPYDFGGETEVFEGDRFKSALEAIKDLDAERLERILMNAGVELSQPELLNKFIIPLMFTIGELWQSGEIRIAHEHLASEVVRNFLINIIRSYRTDDSAPVLIIATPQGQLHEIGAIAAGVTAASLGWRIVHLGADLPFREIAYSLKNQRAKALILGIIYPKDDLKLASELKELTGSIEKDVKILVTGSGAPYYSEIIEEIGAVMVNTPKELVEALNLARLQPGS